MSAKNILLVGCGNLGSSMLGQWLKKTDAHFTLLVRTPSLPLLDLIEPYANRIVINPTAAFKADVAVLAVKPQQMDEAIVPLTHGLPPETLVVSVAAGKRISYYEERFSPGQPIVRAIPNMAASIGESMTVCVANKNVKDRHRTMATELFEAIGKLIWHDNDENLTGVTAVSGSGPAFVYLLAILWRKRRKQADWMQRQQRSSRGKPSSAPAQH